MQLAILLALAGCGGDLPERTPTEEPRPAPPTPSATTFPPATASPEPAPTPRPGTPDETFGVDGITTIAVPYIPIIHSIHIDTLGRIYVLGVSLVFETAENQRLNERQLALLRLSPNGAVDRSFGSAGVVETPVTSSLATCASRSVCDDRPSDMVVLGDGRIVVAVDAQSSAFRERPEDDRSRRVVVAYAPGGVLDPDFGDGGFGMLSFRDDDFPPSFFTPADDDILVFGGFGSGPAAMRIDGEFTADLDFGDDGVLVPPLDTPVGSGFIDAVSQPDGRILTQIRGGQFGVVTNLLAAYTAAGVLDTTFGDEGVASTSPLGTGSIELTLPSVDALGRIVLAFAAKGPTISRLSADGSLDTTFGDTGVATVPFAPVRAFAQPDGGIVVVGRDPSAALLRLDENGTVDPSFGNDGVARFEHESFIRDALDLGDGRILIAATTPDNEIVVMRFITE